MGRNIKSTVLAYDSLSNLVYRHMLFGESVVVSQSGGSSSSMVLAASSLDVQHHEKQNCGSLDETLYPV